MISGTFSDTDVEELVSRCYESFVCSQVALLQREGEHRPVVLGVQSNWVAGQRLVSESQPRAALQTEQLLFVALPRPQATKLLDAHFGQSISAYLFGFPASVPSTFS